MDDTFIKFCKDYDFEIKDMSTKDIEKIKNSFSYNAYTLGIELTNMGNILARDMKNIF